MWPRNTTPVDTGHVRLPCRDRVTSCTTPASRRWLGGRDEKEGGRHVQRVCYGPAAARPGQLRAAHAPGGVRQGRQQRAAADLFHFCFLAAALPMLSPPVPSRASSPPLLPRSSAPASPTQPPRRLTRHGRARRVGYLLQDGGVQQGVGPQRRLEHGLLHRLEPVAQVLQGLEACAGVCVSVGAAWVG